MKKKSTDEMHDELRPEYDLRQLLKRGVRGKYATRYQAGANLVLLAPDVAKAFAHDAGDFDDWEIKPDFEKEAISLWPHWLGEANLHKLDEGIVKGTDPF